jgi:hypothetical protein
VDFWNPGAFMLSNPYPWYEEVQFRAGPVMGQNIFNFLLLMAVGNKSEVGGVVRREGCEFATYDLRRLTWNVGWGGIVKSKSNLYFLPSATLARA